MFFFIKSKFLFSQEIPPENKTSEEEKQTSEDETNDKSLDEKKEIVRYFLFVFKLIQFKKISNQISNKSFYFFCQKSKFLIFFLAKKYLLKLKLQKKKGKLNFVKTKRKKRKLWKVVNFLKLSKMKRSKNYFLVIS